MLNLNFKQKLLANSSVSQVVAMPENFIQANAAVLIEKSTGDIIYKLNENEKLPIASVTKTMTMLLCAEALESGKIDEKTVVQTSEYAASMGGSQIFLEAGEKLTIKDLLKSVIISSANDAAVCIAEHISGSEVAFVELMNKRALEIGAKNTHFTNCNGLNETSEHCSTAYDIALISKELLKHKCISKYMTTWMDSIRGGTFNLSNTNKLLKTYIGTTGIKTGSTNLAKFCLASSAKRDNMELIAVVLGSSTSEERFKGATKLLNYGFANYSVVNSKSIELKMDPVKITKGKANEIIPILEDDFGFLIKKGDKNNIKYEVKLEPQVSAPVKKGDKVGELIVKIDDNEIGRGIIHAGVDVEKINFFEMVLKITNAWSSYNNYFYN